MSQLCYYYIYPLIINYDSPVQVSHLLLPITKRLHYFYANRAFFFEKINHKYILIQINFIMNLWKCDDKGIYFFYVFIVWTFKILSVKSKILNNIQIKIRKVRLRLQNVNIIYLLLNLNGDFQLNDMQKTVISLRLKILFL